MDSSVERRLVKIWYTLGVFILFVLVVVARLFYLQVIYGHVLADLGKKNFLRTEQVLPLRGDVYTDSGLLLASNTPVFDVYWQGHGNYRLTKKHKKLLTFVGDVLEKDFLSDKAAAKTIEYVERVGKRYLIQKNLSFAQVCKLREQCAQEGSLLLENRFERVYPHKNVASHIVGYLSRVERAGRSGLERLFHDHLSGQYGYTKNIISARGKKLKETEVQYPQAGNDLTLTIDMAIQTIAEDIFMEGQTGSVVVMDPETGAIKALVSHPNFDPNLFLYPISQEVWDDKLSEHNPLLNRATRALYPPASIFKLVTFAAALEEGVLTTDSEIECKGHTVFGKRKYVCIRRWGHGTQNLQDSLAVSCNIPCYEIALKLPIDVLANYAYRFGLGQKTGFILPELSGLVPTSGWKIENKGEQWWQGETLSASIGQSYLLVTPLQQARLISAVCTGSLVKPRLLANEPIEAEDLLISTPTLEFLRNSMSSAVQKGTVRRLGYLKEFDIFAKTGTAQTCSLKKQKKSRQDYEHAWLAGYFTYKNQKPLTLVVLVEHVGASLPAVQAADRFLRHYRTLMRQQEQPA